MTESQEVSKLKECMNRKGMFVQVEGEVVGVFLKGFILYGRKLNFLSKCQRFVVLQL